MVLDSGFSFGHLNGGNVFSRSNSSANPLFNTTSTLFGSSAGGSSFPFRSTSGSQGPTTFESTARKQCQGSGVASYCATTEVENSVRKIQSISAMPVYKDKSHDELRLEDHELLRDRDKPLGLTSGFAGSASLGNQVALYSAPQEVDGKIVSISAMQVYKNKSHEELRSEDYESNKEFKVPIQNQGNNAFQKFNSSFDPCTTSRPSSWPTPSSASSILSLSPPNASIFVIPTTSGFHFGTALASSNTSIFGIPASSGSQGPTTFESTAGKQCQGNGVASYCATTEVDPSKNSVMKIQSISAMPVYKDKSHDELSLEDYELLHDRGAQFLNSSPFKTSHTPANIFNQSSLNSTFPPFKSGLFSPKIGNFTNPNITISTVPTLSPPVNAFTLTDSYPSRLPTSVPQPNAAASFTPINTPNPSPFSLTPSVSESVPANSNQCPLMSTTFTTPSIETFSWCKPFVTLTPPPSIETFSWSKPFVTHTPPLQSTSVAALGFWPFSSIASKHDAEKVDSVSTNNQSQPSPALSGLPTVKEFSCQNENRQQDVSSITSHVQSSLAGNPFAMEFPNVQSNAVASIQHGISSLPVSDNLPANRRTSLFRIQHVSSRHPSLPAQRPSYETKVPFFIDEVAKPAPFLPRENPRAWVKNPTSHSNTVLKDEEDLCATFSSQVMKEDVHTEKHEADVIATMPKLPEGDYYTKPSLKELAAAEMAEPGWCSHVEDFTVGRRGHGSIKFLGETDIRHLDLESIVQFHNREVIVYLDDRKKPPVGRGLNKPAEVTLLNVKCISNKSGKQYVEGPQVDRYKEMLVNKTLEVGGEFVSYDPVEGDWKFRVQHF